MNSTVRKNPEIESLRVKIRDAQDVVADKLVEAFGRSTRADYDFNISYARASVTVYDRLASIAAYLDKIESELRDIEEGGWFDFFEDPDATERSRAFIEKNFGDPTSTDDKKSDGRPIIEIKITEGMIRQNLMTFTKPVKRKRLKVGQKIILETKSETIESEIIEPGNKLRERGAVGRLYRESHAQPNDLLVLTPMGPKEENRWQVAIKPYIKPFVTV